MTQLPLLIQEKLDFYKWQYHNSMLIEEYHERDYKLYYYGNSHGYVMTNNYRYFNWRRASIDSTSQGKIYGRNIQSWKCTVDLPKNYWYTGITKLIKSHYQNRMTHLPLLVQEKVDFYRWRYHNSRVIGEYHKYAKYTTSILYIECNYMYYNYRLNNNICTPYTICTMRFKKINNTNRLLGMMEQHDLPLLPKNYWYSGITTDFALNANY